MPWVPRIAGVAPRYHVGRDPALPVRRPRERDERPLAGDEILDLDSVADGEDILVARAHVLVDADSSAFAYLEPGRLRERGLRAHADPEDHDVRGMRLAGIRQDLERTVSRLLETGHSVTESEADTVLFHVALDEARGLGIERRQDLVDHLDQRHFEPAVDKVLRHLQPDESAADHHRTLRPFWTSR